MIRRGFTFGRGGTTSARASAGERRRLRPTPAALPKAPPPSGAAITPPRAISRCGAARHLWLSLWGCLKAVQEWAGFPSPDGCTTVLGGVKSKPASGWLRHSLTPPVRRGGFNSRAMENSTRRGSKKQLAFIQCRRFKEKNTPLATQVLRIKGIATSHKKSWL